MVGIAVDEGCQPWQLGNQVQSVLIGGLPVLELVDACGIGGCELALWLQQGTGVSIMTQASIS